MPMIGLMPGLGRLGPEVVGAVQVAVVGHGHGRHARPFALGEHVLQPRGPIQHRVLGVDVQVDEAIPASPGGRPPGTPRSPLRGGGRRRGCRHESTASFGHARRRPCGRREPGPGEVADAALTWLGARTRRRGPPARAAHQPGVVELTEGGGSRRPGAPDGRLSRFACRRRHPGDRPDGWADGWADVRRPGTVAATLDTKSSSLLLRVIKAFLHRRGPGRPGAPGPSWARPGSACSWPWSPLPTPVARLGPGRPQPGPPRPRSGPGGPGSPAAASAGRTSSSP